jgi:hypothetical protein
VSVTVHSARCATHHGDFRDAGQAILSLGAGLGDTNSTRWSKLFSWEQGFNKHLLPGDDITVLPVTVELLSRSLFLRSSVLCKSTFCISVGDAEKRHWYPLASDWEICLSFQCYETGLAGNAELVSQLKSILDTPLPPLTALPEAAPAPPPAPPPHILEKETRDPSSTSSSEDDGNPSLSGSQQTTDEFGSYGAATATASLGTESFGSYGGATTTVQAEDESSDSDDHNHYNYRHNMSGVLTKSPGANASPQESLNQRYQTQVELLKRIDASMATGSQTIPLDQQLDICDTLVAIADDFVHRAENYAKTIIEELFLPDTEKTVKPVEMGGALGGRKYVVSNILFKVSEKCYFYLRTCLALVLIDYLTCPISNLGTQRAAVFFQRSS